MMKDKSIIGALGQLSPVIATLILGIAGIIVTWQYNSGQLEIAHRRELSELIQIIAGTDENARKMAAIMLPYHGDRAIPALISLLNEDSLAATTARESLLAMGKRCKEQLKAVYMRPLPAHHNDCQRGNALYLLAMMNPEEWRDVLRKVIKDESEAEVVRIRAIGAVNDLQDMTFCEDLKSISLSDLYSNSMLSQYIVWYLVGIDPKNSLDYVKEFLNHPNREVRKYTIEQLWGLGDVTLADAICTASESEQTQLDANEKSKEVAKDACMWFKLHSRK